MNELISLRYPTTQRHVFVDREGQQDAEVAQRDQKSHVQLLGVLPAQLVDQVPVEHVVEEDETPKDEGCHKAHVHVTFDIISHIRHLSNHRSAEQDSEAEPHDQV